MDMDTVDKLMRDLAGRAIDAGFINGVIAAGMEFGCNEFDIASFLVKAQDKFQLDLNNATPEQKKFINKYVEEYGL